MMHYLVPLLFVGLLAFPVFVRAQSNQLPLMLAKTYSASTELARYVVSEKYDGVRAVWHNGELRTRNGRQIHAPAWFLNRLPKVSLEGELWMGYGQFDEISGLVRQQHSEDDRWLDVSFFVFDLPESTALFRTRYDEMTAWVRSANVDWLKVVDHVEIATTQELEAYLAEVIARGGEGLMLNLQDAPYAGARSSALLKYKPVFDDEAKVVGYTDGQGELDGKMGALIVEWKDGRRFKIGTGFSLREREIPPAIGDWVTFHYSGLTSTGLPRFARFVRIYQPL